MKKTICLIALILSAACFLVSCHPDTYTLEESQLDSILSDSYETTKKQRPTAEQILGLYSTEENESSDIKYNIYVRQYGGKITVQVSSPEKTPKELTDEVLENITSNYDESSGKFTQSYVSEDHTSVYEAYFSLEGKKVKIDLSNTYFYHTDGVVRSGLKIIGYKNEY